MASGRVSDIEYVRRTIARLGPVEAIDRVRSSTRAQRFRERVIAEETDCHLCGTPVDKSLSGMDPMGPTIDHVVSVRHDLERFFDRSNVRLAHRSCNCKAGGGLPVASATERLALSRAGGWLGDRLTRA